MAAFEAVPARSRVPAPRASNAAHKLICPLPQRCGLALARAADREAVDAQRRLPDAHRHGLTLLPADADAGV